MQLFLFRQSFFSGQLSYTIVMVDFIYLVYKISLFSDSVNLDIYLDTSWALGTNIFSVHCAIKPKPFGLVIVENVHLFVYTFSNTTKLNMIEMRSCLTKYSESSVIQHTIN